MDISTSLITNWSVPKSFHNNKNTLYSTKKEFVTNFKEKAELFNSFFAKQCSIIDNGSEIPSFLQPKTDTSLSNITFTEKNTEKVIQNLDSNKAHGHYMISIQMLKMCGKSILKPLLIVYKKWLEKGCFPNKWKQMLILSIKK